VTFDALSLETIDVDGVGIRTRRAGNGKKS
jgi:hypothetical protein